MSTTLDSARVEDSGLAEERRLQPLVQTMALARRSVVSMARQPVMVVPTFVFPLLIAAVNTAALQRSTNLPGFPEVDSFLQFLLPATMAQGVMLGGINGASEVAVDIENGFFERLLSSPVSRPSLLVGRLSGAAVFGAFQAVAFTAIFMVFGARVEAGLAGLAVLVLVAIGLALAIGALGAAVGFRTGKQEAVQNAFPLVFIFMFLSSAFFPTQLMVGWFKTFAEWNPLTWMIDGTRYQVTVGWNLGEAVVAVGVAYGLAVLTIALAISQLRRRLAVTS